MGELYVIHVCDALTFVVDDRGGFLSRKLGYLSVLDDEQLSAARKILEKDSTSVACGDSYAVQIRTARPDASSEWKAHSDMAALNPNDFIWTPLNQRN